MYAVDTKETIHIYYEREEEPKPFVVFPLVCAVLCLLGVAACTLYSLQHPYYEHTRLLVPAVVLPPQTFRTSVTVIPTGVRTYPATTAHGTLTITNGSVIAQTLPASSGAHRRSAFHVDQLQQSRSAAHSIDPERSHNPRPIGHGCCKTYSPLRPSDS